MNISSAGLMTSVRVDYFTRQFQDTAKGIDGNFVIYNPPSKERVSNHETDKQVEDNFTWVFEYKALLNSKLTTLTTSLTSAFTTDLDAAMGAKLPGPGSVTPPANPQYWGNKNAMQGDTGEKLANGTTIIDPGAARTTYAFLIGFSSDVDISAPADDTWRGDNNNCAAQGASVTMDYNASLALPAGTTRNITGTTTFMAGSHTSANNLSLEKLEIDFTVPNNHTFTYAKDELAGLVGSEIGKKIGNNFSKVLYNFFSKSENWDILRFGMFEDVFVVGTSSLPTGSQVQGSLALNWIPGLANNATAAGYVDIKLERFAAFFHS